MVNKEDIAIAEANKLGIPVIGSVSGALAAVQPGDPIILDADHGQALLRRVTTGLQFFQTHILWRIVQQAQGIMQRWQSRACK